MHSPRRKKIGKLCGIFRILPNLAGSGCTAVTVRLSSKTIQIHPVKTFQIGKLSETWQTHTAIPRLCQASCLHLYTVSSDGAGIKTLFTDRHALRCLLLQWTHSASQRHHRQLMQTSERLLSTEALALCKRCASAAWVAPIQIWFRTTIARLGNLM